MKNEDFLKQLSAKNARIWRRTVNRIVRDRDMTDDVMQESWRKVLASRVAFESPHEWEKYYMRTLVNTAHDHSLVRSRISKRSTELKHALHLSDGRDDQLGRVIRKERQERNKRILREVIAIVQNLPVTQRQAIVLLINKRPAESLLEISRREGIAVSTLRSRMYSGIRSIRRLLTKRGVLLSD